MDTQLPSQAIDFCLGALESVEKFDALLFISSGFNTNSVCP